jgi:hypothetical protein
MAPPNAAPQGAKLTLRCPGCGSTDLATSELLTGSSCGRATLTIEPGGELHPEFHHDGWTDVNWGSSTTVGVECRSCMWSYTGVDSLDQLTIDFTEDHR